MTKHLAGSQAARFAQSFLVAGTFLSPVATAHSAAQLSESAQSSGLHLFRNSGPEGIDAVFQTRWSATARAPTAARPNLLPMFNTSPHRRSDPQVPAAIVEGGAEEKSQIDILPGEAFAACNAASLTKSDIARLLIAAVERADPSFALAIAAAESGWRDKSSSNLDDVFDRKTDRQVSGMRRDNASATDRAHADGAGAKSGSPRGWVGGVMEF